MTVFGQPSTDLNSPFYDDPLYGQPWQSRERSEELRRKRHRLWLSRLTSHDWERISALAEHVTPLSTPARLEDLDAKGIAVGVAPAENPAFWGSGERVGTVRGGQIAVLVWRK